MSAMPLLREAIQLERRVLGAERVGLWIVLILIAAIVYALANGSGWIGRQQGLLAAARAEQAERIAEQREHLTAMNAGRYSPPSAFLNPANPLWIGNRHAATYAALPPAPLAITAIGQSDLNPPYVKVNAESHETFALNEEIENPDNLLIGHFDLAFFIVFLLPLVIIVLSYNLLSAEREQGTLALVASNPVKLATLLGAKLLYRLGLVALPVFGVVLIALPIIGVPLFAAQTLAPLAWWSALVLAWIGLWFALVAAATVFGRGSAQNALALVSLWIVLVLVLPTLLSVAVSLAYPTPSRAEMINHLRGLKAEAGKAFDADGARFALEHEAHAGGVLNAKEFGAAVERVKVQDLAAAKIDDVLHRHEASLIAQRWTVAWLRFLSPAILMQEALNDVAGTGEGRYQAYSEQVDGFYAQWRAFFLPKVLANTALTLADYDTFPRFVWAEPPASALNTRLWPALLGLSLPLALLLAFALRRVSRYPVTG